MDEEHLKRDLANSLREDGFDTSIEENRVRYEDFFNEAYVSLERAGDNTRVDYEIAITPICTTVIILSLLLALLVGVILVFVWYLKYSSLQRAIRSGIDKLQDQRDAPKKAR